LRSTDTYTTVVRLAGFTHEVGRKLSSRISRFFWAEIWSC
jgi:hypothetical protein